MDSSDESRLYLAGQAVPAGRYCRVDRSDRPTVDLYTEGVLPASLDGQVAVYRRLPVPPTIRQRLASVMGRRREPVPID